MATCSICSFEFEGETCPQCRPDNPLAVGLGDPRDDNDRLGLEEPTPIATRGSDPTASESTSRDTADTAPAQAALRVGVMGPMNSGKTDLATALTVAANLPDDPDRHIECIPGEALARRMRRANQALLRRRSASAATAAAESFGLFLRYEERGRLFRPRVQQAADVVIHGGPGGALFPSELGDRESQAAVNAFQRDLTERMAEADVLVLVVDAARGHSDELVQELPALLSRICHRRPVSSTKFPPTLAERLLPGRSEPPRIQKPQLRARRFLILCNKADTMAADILDLARSGQGASDEAALFGELLLGGLSPLELAGRLDPLECALQLFGRAMLHSILGVLPDDATLAVGLTSAWGFDGATGEPLVDHRGVPRLLGAESAHDLLRARRPFGLRDAMRFMLTGQAGGSVSAIREEDLCVEGGVAHPGVEVLRFDDLGP